MIFISHSTTEDKFVDTLRVELHRAGYHTWVDHFDAPAGRHWDEAVDEKLRECTVMILVLSSESMNSRNVNAEWREFLRQGKSILPIKVKDCTLPLLLRDLTFIDFTDNARYTEQLSRLLKSLPAPISVSAVAQHSYPIPPAPMPSDSQTIAIQHGEEVVEDARANRIHHPDDIEVQLGQVQFFFPELGKTRVFDLKSEKTFIGWHDPKSGSKPDIDLTRYDAPAKGVSRQHAVLTRTAQGMTLMDLDSRNGTYIYPSRDRLPAFEPVVVKNETLIRLGTLRVRVFFRT